MAYGDYGARVYKDGERRTDREDVAVFAELGAISLGIWGHLLSLGPGEYPKYEMCRHAVLGDGVVRLCGYKSYPELWAMRRGRIEEVDLPDWDYMDKASMRHDGQITIEGRVWTWFFEYDGESSIELVLTEPDGSRWEGTSGYGYGFEA